MRKNKNTLIVGEQKTFPQLAYVQEVSSGTAGRPSEFQNKRPTWTGIAPFRLTEMKDSGTSAGPTRAGSAVKKWTIVQLHSLLIPQR